MKILVTGAAGFIGSHLTERLLQQGHSVTGIDNFDPYYDPALKRHHVANIAARWGRPDPGTAAAPFRLIEGDYGDAALLDEVLALNRFDAVVHLAAQAGVRPSLQDPAKYERANVTNLIILLEALRKHGPRRIVAASSSSVYGNETPLPFREDAPCLRPEAPYGASKRAAEIYLGVYAKQFGFEAIIVRPFTVYGPRQRPDMAIAPFSRKILLGEPITLYGDGLASRDYTYVGDIVQGLVKSLAFPVRYGIYNLSGDNSTSLLELIRAIEQVAEKKALVQFQPFQAGDMQHTRADLSLARRDLGYSPEVSLQEGLRLTLAWVREELQRKAN